MKSLGHVVMAVAVMGLSACAFQKQAIKLQPTVEVATSDTGAGKALRLNVSDERPRATLGTRGAGGIGEQLTLEGDLVDTVRVAVGDGLRAQGFGVDGSADHQLRVEIRNLDYTLNSGFWAGKLNIEFLLKGICIRGNERPYEQVYRGEFRKNIQVVQNEDSNNIFVNQAVSQAINALLNDQQLIRCLAE